MIKNAMFTSVWDGGTEIKTSCKVNIDTKEVFDIEVNDSDEIEGLDTLDREYITIDGIGYAVYNVEEGKEDLTETDFWYE